MLHRHGRGRADREVGAQHALSAVFECHLGLDMARVCPRIERIDQARIALGYGTAAHLAGAGQLAVVGIEFLGQDQEVMDLRCREVRLDGEVAVRLGDAVGDQLIDLLVRRQLLV